MLEAERRNPIMAAERPEEIFLAKVAIPDTMPGLWIEVMSSSISAISAMIAKILESVAALPNPISAVITRIGMIFAPS